MMVMQPSAMHPFIHGSPAPNKPSNASCGGNSPFWDLSPLHKENYNQSDYAHHIRSSSYQLMHTRQAPRGAYHHRQHSNNSTYSEGDEPSPKNSRLESHSSRRSPFSIENSRCFSFENVIPEPIPHIERSNWNTSEPDLNFMNSYISAKEGFPFGNKELLDSPKLCPTSPTPSTNSRCKNSSSSRLSAGSPPAPPVRDASSLKYIRYGPGHEKYPSWPVPAGSANQVLPNIQSPLGANISGLPDGSYHPPPQGSHRSHSWTEQSDYPKDKSGGYVRPHHKKISPSHKHLIGKCEKIPPSTFASRFADDILQSPDYSLMDDYLNHSSMYYPPYDREGREIGDKDYSIPSPPERDPGMGEANLSQVTAAQLEEHSRQYDYGYGEFPQITPLLDQLRQESYMWDGDSEKDSGRGESESVADSSRYSNGRESVTTVVTNSSSASSSETLKWHGSMSDVSSLSGISRDMRMDHNIVHSSKVLAPQRHNSESVLYYSSDGKKVPHPKFTDVTKHFRDPSRYNSNSDYSRYPKDARWGREPERKNEINNLKKFPSYSYTQPLSQISEAPVAESSETPDIRSMKNPVIDNSKQRSVADRINDIERQSRSIRNEVTTRWPRDLSEPRNIRRTKDEFHRRDPSLGREVVTRKEFHRNNSERDLTLMRLEQSDKKLTNSPMRESFNNGAIGSNARSSLTPNKSFRSPPGSVHPRSPHNKKDLNDSVLSNDSVISPLNESDRFSSHSRSFTYLDPEKKCMVPDATLKSIQKQAILSFYERRTGKNANGVPQGQDPSAKVSNGASPPSSKGFVVQNPRISRPERVHTKGVARLGRVPDPDEVQHQTMPSAPFRRKSINGRDVCREESPRQEASPHSSPSSNSPTRTDPPPPPLPPLKPQKAPVSNKLDGGPEGEESHGQEDRNLEDNSYQRSLPEVSSLSVEARLASSSSSLPFTQLSICHSAIKLKEELPTPTVPQSPPPPQAPAAPAPALPPPPLTAEETPPKPPDRPPKRPSLRSLFQSPRGEISFQQPISSPEKLSPESLEIRLIEQSAEELRNLTTPTKPSFYRKPPAPDPPESPPIAPPDKEVGTSIPEVPSAAPLSRSSTPELPPPPPPPVTDVVFSDDPLPPPPADVPPSVPPPPHEGAYHKDSYVAHRKDLKTGYEGRYRRTQSPSAPHQRTPSNACNKSKNFSNGNTLLNKNNNNNNLSNSFYTASSVQPNGMLRSAYSTSNIIHPPSSVLDNETKSRKLNSVANGSSADFSSPIVQHNGWAAHPRQTSTTVNFTAEELRALKAKRAAPERMISAGNEREFAPHKGATMPNTRDPVGGSMCSLSTEGSSSSSSSSSVPYSESLPLHLGSFWTTSLDCLHRTSPESPPKANSFPSPPGRNMSRAISIGEPLCTIVDHERVPRLVPVSSDISLNRSTSASDSLQSVSCSGRGVSRSNSINSESLSSPYNIDNNEFASSHCSISHDGPITAHPATVTEESQPPSPCSSKGSVDDARPLNSPVPFAPPSQASLVPDLPQSPPSVSLNETNSPNKHTITISTSPAAVTTLSNQSPLTPIHSASSSNSSQITNQILPPISSSSSLASSTSNSSLILPTSNAAPPRVPYKRTLSATGTCPAMTPLDTSDSDLERTNIVVLGYGRTKSQEEIDCDLLLSSNKFAQQLGVDTRLQTLLGNGDSQKTAGDYMTGVFTLELRSDMLCRCHASHPDLKLESTFSVASPSPQSGVKGPSSASPSGDASESGLGDRSSIENQDGKLRNTDESCSVSVGSSRYQQPDKKLSIASQLGAKSLDSTLLDLPLRKKKEELISSINRKMDALNKQRETIKKEISENSEVGLEVSCKLEAKAKTTEVNKIKNHIEEIDKITSLLLSLAVRLAKVENSLSLGTQEEDKGVLEGKREKLTDQMDEAKKLKESIDRRAIQVSKILGQYLSEEEYAKYDHFIKMKAKLLMDARETQDKIQLAADQLAALKDSLPNS